jgi:[lysine-biosynthesis-protein LysW]--L-2-aminoadipate ligase
MTMLRERNGAWIVTGQPTLTDELLLGTLHDRGVRADIVQAPGLTKRVQAGEVVLGRLDVRPTLDGVEPGLRELRRLERSGVSILNRASALLACHDKLQTARMLGRLGLPQPATAHIRRDVPPPDLDYPVVVKPRFGSWGTDVTACASRRELLRRLDELGSRDWFRRQGVLVQELIPPLGYDLRIVVARDRVIGAIHRVAAEGDWRTNIALGGRREAANLSPDACGLAVAAAAAVGADLAGVDLLPTPGGGHVVLEVNGAVDFNHEYALAGRDPFGAAAEMIEAAVSTPSRACRST